MNPDPAPSIATSASTGPAGDQPEGDAKPDPSVPPLPAPSGPPVADLAAFDDLMQRFLAEQQVPGATLSIGKGGKLLFARGYGWSDRETEAPMAANSRFRIASISKPITAHLVLRLANRGLFKLDDFVTQHLPDEFSFAISAVDDERWFLVTLRQLLQHTGGWDRDGTDFDPMFESTLIAEAFSEQSPASLSSIIRYMLGRPLDFHPGSKYSYSNFGYCLLGRVIEKVTGVSYAQAARDELWDPLGLAGEIELGASLKEQRLPREVTYTPSTDETEPGVFPKNLGKPVPPPYGAFCLETMDAHGGWVGSAPALVLWSMSLEPPTKGWLRSETWIDAFKRPDGAAGLDNSGQPAPIYYGLGWQVRPTDDRGGFHRWHAGSLPGCSTLLIKRDDDLHIAVLFNRRHDNREKAPARLIDPELHKLANQVERWPERDLTADVFPPPK